MISKAIKSSLTIQSSSRLLHVAPYVELSSLTESCPDRYWGASLSMLGLIGEVTEMEGRSIFWDSKELEPGRAQTTQSDNPPICLLFVVFAPHREKTGDCSKNIQRNETQKEHKNLAMWGKIKRQGDKRNLRQTDISFTWCFWDD